MLIDPKNGREFNADKLPRGGKARDAVLATLREVPIPQKMRGPMFSLQERALLKQSEVGHVR